MNSNKNEHLNPNLSYFANILGIKCFPWMIVECLVKFLGSLRSCQVEKRITRIAFVPTNKKKIYILYQSSVKSIFGYARNKKYHNQFEYSFLIFYYY